MIIIMIMIIIIMIIIEGIQNGKICILVMCIWVLNKKIFYLKNNKKYKYNLPKRTKFLKWNAKFHS